MVLGEGCDTFDMLALCQHAGVYVLMGFLILAAWSLKQPRLLLLTLIV